MIGKIKHCNRCGHDWMSRLESPIRCPLCQYRLNFIPVPDRLQPPPIHNRTPENSQEVNAEKKQEEKIEEPKRKINFSEPGEI